MEVARLVQEALSTAERESTPLPEIAVYFLDRFKKEYADELKAFDTGTGRPAKNFLKPIEEVQARYVYVDGQPRHFFRYPEAQANVGIRASEGTPLVYNNDGVIYGQGNNGSLQFSTSMRFFDIFSGYVQPIVVGRQDVEGFDFGKLSEGDVDLLTGYAKVSPWNVELEVGRDSMWWGNGRHGELLLTNNATPMDMIKLSNPTPTLLPWIFQYLGPSKFAFFMTVLEDERVNVQEPWFSGLRLDFKPHPLFEVGLTTTMMFNGDRGPKISFVDFLGTFTGFAFGEQNTVDKLASLDFRAQLPFLRNTEIYGEYAGEDSGGTQYPEEWFGLGDVGYLLGIYAPMLTSDGKTDLRLEFARNAHRVDDTPTFWYGHRRYKSGYTYDRLIMGHHMAGDAMDAFARVTRYLRNDLQVGVDYDYMERGITLSETQEKVNQVGVDATYYIWSNLSVMLRYGFETVDNYDLEPGVSHNNNLLMTVVKFGL